MENKILILEFNSIKNVFYRHHPEIHASHELKVGAPEFQSRVDHFVEMLNDWRNLKESKLNFYAKGPIRIPRETVNTTLDDPFWSMDLKGIAKVESTFHPVMIDKIFIEDEYHKQVCTFNSVIFVNQEDSDDCFCHLQKIDLELLNYRVTLDKSLDWSEVYISKVDLMRIEQYYGIFNHKIDLSSGGYSVPVAPYLDESHPLYSDQLHLAIEAWMAVAEGEFMNNSSKPPSQKIEQWIRDNNRLNLTNTAIRRLVRVANTKERRNPGAKKY